MAKLQFCITLQQRRECRPAVAALRAARWHETTLVTHDAAMILPAQQSHRLHEATLHAIFVSAADFKETGQLHPHSTVALRRIEQLYHLDGSGQNSVIIFVLEARSDDRPAGDAMNAYTKLQADLMQSDLVMPIVACARWTLVPQTLITFHRQLCVHRRPAQQLQNKTKQVLEVLRHSATRKPLSDHGLHVLTDLTTGFRDYLGKLDGSETRDKISEYLGDEGERALAFWYEEYVIE